MAKKDKKMPPNRRRAMFARLNADRERSTRRSRHYRNPPRQRDTMVNTCGQQAGGGVTWSMGARKTTGPAYKSDSFHAARWKQYSVFKSAAQIAFPQAAVPIEVGYIFLCSLDTIRADYNISKSDRSNELGRALNITIGEIEKQTMSYVIPPIGNDAVSIIVEKSSEYLEQERLFTDLTVRLGLEESCSRDFCYFYENSLRSCLNQKFGECVDQFR